MGEASSASEFPVILLLVIAGIAVFYATLTLFSAWLIQRKSAEHPVRNGIIAAAIPGVIFVLIGMFFEFVISPSDPNFTGLFSVIVAAIAFVLFLVVGLASGILFCKKLAKGNQPDQDKKE